MGKRKDKRRKLAAKVIRRALREVDPYIYDNGLTDQLTDRQFDALVNEIRQARITVTWRS